MTLYHLTRRGFLLAAGGLIASPVVPTVAAQGATPTVRPGTLGYPSLVIEATNRGLHVPASIAAGRILVTLINHSSHVARADILAEPTTSSVADDVITLAQTAGLPARYYRAKFTGGPGVIAPGDTSQAIIDVPPGHYLVVNPPTQSAAFTATSGRGGTPGPNVPPPYRATVTFLDFTYHLPLLRPTGPQIWRAVNHGKVPHAMDLHRVPPGTKYEQALEYLRSQQSDLAAPSGGLAPSKVTPSGGLSLLAPGASAFAVLNLPAGTYIASCSLADPASGKPQFVLGMLAVFNVGAPGNSSPS